MNTIEKDLREIVQHMVEAALDEALRRDDYVNRLVSAAAGIMGEYFKARFAGVNSVRRRHGVLGTEEGWDKEARQRLEYNFKQAVRKRITGDKRKAFDEALDELRDEVTSTLAWARAKVAEAFGLEEADMSEPLEDPAEELFAMLVNAFDEETEAQRRRREERR